MAPNDLVLFAGEVVLLVEDLVADRELPHVPQETRDVDRPAAAFGKRQVREEELGDGGDVAQGIEIDAAREQNLFEFRLVFRKAFFLGGAAA